MKVYEELYLAGMEHLLHEGNLRILGNGSNIRAAIETYDSPSDSTFAMFYCGATSHAIELKFSSFKDGEEYYERLRSELIALYIHLSKAQPELRITASLGTGAFLGSR